MMKKITKHSLSSIYNQ